ncbi:transposase [Streptomyces sp. CB00072]|nr:transposase [Streptomyces sp. CB00072]
MKTPEPASRVFDGAGQDSGAGRRGRPRHRPRALYADRGYDFDVYRRRLRERNITPKIAHRGQAHGSGLGRVRWVAESAIAHLHGPRRLPIRWETRDDIHDAFLQLAHCMNLARRAF